MAAADTQLPPTYKGMVYDNPGTLSLKMDKELKMPEPGPGEVLIHLSHSGVCHSDLSVMLNGWRFLPAPTPAGQVGGHEGVGKVVKLGAGADVHCKVGDRVGVKWVSSACGSCGACMADHEGVCFNSKISGYYTPGTFQEYTLGPANYVTPIPEGLESAAAAPFLCGGVTVYAALKKSGTRPGQWVAILGAGGGLGHLGVQMAARGMGLRVVGIDHSSKKQLATDSGAEHFFGIDQEQNMAEAVQGVTGGLGVHAVINVTASNKAYEGAMDLLRFGGRLMCVGIPEGDMVPVGHAYPPLMVAKETSIQGVAVGSRKDAIETLDMAARGVVKMHYNVKKMEDLPQIFQDMQDGKLMGRTVLEL
ncbi:MAG: hypothetical protein M1828_001425 [Chrysothrix sp. TS-e1954]|nr:MAG: hypothetical protein M1828_001425 [Chrysothrix sp. TS-e1954]